jgi:hypothetical protein
MAMITVQIDDPLLLKVLNSAAAKKMSLEEHMEAILSEAEDEGEPEFADHAAAINEAIQRAAKRKKGSLFKLHELFHADEWAGIRSPTWFGRKFRPAIEESGIAAFHTKDVDNKIIYKRS